ncbi:hypothetical protein OK016_29875 [Vibrio chagasii]|nr:hypothetical protein [Vibrio chagasii]
MQSWETEDNQTFVFHLRKDAQWCEWRSALTAMISLYAIRRAVDLKRHRRRCLVSQAYSNQQYC